MSDSSRPKHVARSLVYPILSFLMGLGAGVDRDEEGFGLIELLVVVTILAILISISLPIYLNQRERAYIASIQNTLKNTAVQIEAYAVTTGGDYQELDGQSAGEVDELVEEGYKEPEWAEPPGYVQIEATQNRFCVEARHRTLGPNEKWRDATFDSENPRPLETPNVCPDL